MVVHSVAQPRIEDGQEQNRTRIKTETVISSNMYMSEAQEHIPRVTK